MIFGAILKYYSRYLSQIPLETIVLPVQISSSVTMIIIITITIIIDLSFLIELFIYFSPSLSMSWASVYWPSIAELAC